MSHIEPPRTALSTQILSSLGSICMNCLIFALIFFSGGSEKGASATLEASSTRLHCRYIEDGQYYQIEHQAATWQEAEELICGANYRDLHLGKLLTQSARLLSASDAQHPLILAQRESCSCSADNQIPVLQDIGIVEAPRLGEEKRDTALPRIMNNPEPTEANRIQTDKETSRPARLKREEKKVSVDDLLSAANNFDEARPANQDTLSGSNTGSRLSNSETGKGDPYLQKVKAQLDNTMKAPPSISKSELSKLSAKIWIRIGATGAILAWGFHNKSGHDSFDRMIETVVKQYSLGGTMKFAQPPANWNMKDIPITIAGKDIR